MTTALPSPIRRPGTDVLQVLESNEVRIVRPILQEVIVGPCFKVLEVTDSDGSLEEDARISLPAIYQGLDTAGVGAATAHTATATDILSIAMPGVAALSVDFEDGTSYTPAQAAAFIQDKANLAGMAITAEAVALTSTDVTLRIASVSRGSGQSLTIVWNSSATMPTTFKLPHKWVATGYDRYDNTRLFVTKDMLPDPWNLGDDMDVLESSVRGFLTTASAIKKELQRTSSVNRTVSSKLGVVDDGDGDMSSPLVTFIPNGTDSVYPLDIIGVEALATLTSVEYGTLAFAVTVNEITRTTGSWITDNYHEPGSKITIAGATDPANNGTFTVVSATELVLTVEEALATEIASATETVTGTTYPAEDAYLTGFDAAATQAAVTNNGDVTWPLAADVVIDLEVDGWQLQRITLASGSSAAQAAAEINRYFPGVATDAADVTITSPTYGRESFVRFRDVTEMFFNYTTFKVVRGRGQKPKIGDELWTGSTKIGTIAQLVTVDATGTVAQVVRLDTELSATYFDSTTPWGSARKDWYIVSKNLDDEQFISEVSSGDTPELTVTEYVIQFKPDGLRGSRQDPMYKPVTPTDVNCYGAVFFKALRLDVTVAATTRDAVPIQISAGDFAGLDTQFAPLDAQNPLGLAAYFALLNTTQTPIWIFGVDEVTDDYPEGTPDAYARAFAGLKAIRGYGIVPLSQDLDVALNLHAHVQYMSATKRKNERYGFVTFEVPDRDEPTLVGSGTEGNATDPGGGSPWAFQTGLADLGDLFLAAGLETTMGWDTDDGVYLNVEGDTNNYLVTGYAGATITCRKRISTEDDFYADALWTDAIVDKNFAIYVRGDELVDTAGNPDRSAIALAIGKRCTKFQDRRMDVGAPGEVEATVGGLTTRLPTYYLAAAQVSQRCSLHPAKPLTNSPIQGFTRVLNSSGYIPEDDMDQAAGYGLWWWVNDEVAGTVVTRHQLTTDPTSIKTREDSIRVAVDFGTYAIRDAIAPLIGTMNITSQTLDMLSMVMNGVLSFLMDTKVWLTARIIRMVQGPFEATEEDLAEGLEAGGEDEVLIEVDVTVGSPLNRVRVRLLV